MLSSGKHQHCEECGTRLYRAGDQVPAGSYLRVDDGSFHRLSLPGAGPLPASYDGHVAQYRAAAAPCMCQLQCAEAAGIVRLSAPKVHEALVTAARIFADDA